MTAGDVYRILQLAQVVLFVGLGLAALRQWLRYRTAAAGWIALAYGTFGAVVLAARAVTDDPTTQLEQWEIKILLAALLLFPYFLYRFMVSLLGRRRWAWVVGHVLTGSILVFTFALPEIPQRGEPRTPVFTAYVIVLLVQWGFLTIRVVQRLWSAGRQEPRIARRRMRLLAAGALILLIALIIGGLSPAGEEISKVQVLTASIVLLSGPIMLLGFAPPQWLLAIWRQREDVALREAEIALIRALTAREVADQLLPALARYLGVRSAALYDASGALIGAHGSAAQSALPLDGEEIRFERGHLTVMRSSLAPYFGEEERKTLQAVAGLTDLALARAELFEREARNTEAMRDFIAIASHDLRTPITVIGGIGSLLTTRWDRLSEADRFELVSKVETHAGHIGRIVEDLLTVSKVEARALDLVIEELPLASLVADVLEEFPEERGRITTEVPRELVIAADKDHLKRILRNYLSNAFVYGEPPVELSAHIVEGAVEIRIRDHGEGVPDDFLPRLFGKFARADKKMSKATAGTGLGLSIVRGLAREMGGDAFYEPANPGARFGVRLPMHTTRTDG